MHTCRNCNQSFQTELALELHRDTCKKGQLFCQVCGERFREGDATQDGWHYECPNDECEAEGLQENLYRIEDVRTTTTH